MTEAVTLLAQSPVALIAVTAVLGLMMGSFLNVVVLRLPPRLEHRWQASCAELTGSAPPAEAPPGLVAPRSRCPQCGHGITALENLPVISYLLLRGRCRACGQRISPRYPILEALTGLLSALAAWRFGFSADLLGALALIWLLIALSGIDLDHQLLPDDLTLPGIWGGLLFSLVGGFTDPVASIIGASAGYLSLWGVYQVFRLLTGKEGMGYGDFKLLALLGAWLGWQALPGIILLSAAVGAAVGGALILLQGRDSQVPIPFGPFLAMGGWLMLMWGDAINAGYLRFAGLA